MSHNGNVEFPALAKLRSEFVALESGVKRAPAAGRWRAWSGLVACLLAAGFVLSPAGATVRDSVGELVGGGNTVEQRQAAEQRELNAPENLVVEALACRAWPVSDKQARSVSWCTDALNALETRPDVQALAQSGDYEVQVDGMTATITLPDGTEAVSTFER